MGKDIKGKELGKGISQRSDLLYLARFTDRTGKRRQKVFSKLQECRQWLADAQFEDEQGDCLFDRDMKVKDVKPFHCQQVMNRMAEDGYTTSTIYQARIALFNLLDYAVQNDVIIKNPCNKTVKANIGKAVTKREALTIEQQRKFLKGIKGNTYENQYAFLLQTGLRTGELVGLRWSDIDFDNRILHVNQTMEYRYAFGEWRDCIFLSRKGSPVKNSAYDTMLRKQCEKIGIPNFSMHVLRHTFATRCIEAGMKPKTLQTILGHSNISITMNRYVHTTEEEKRKEMVRISEALKVV